MDRIILTYIIQTFSHFWVFYCIWLNSILPDWMAIFVTGNYYLQSTKLVKLPSQGYPLLYT